MTLSLTDPNGFLGFPLEDCERELLLSLICVWGREEFFAEQFRAKFNIGHIDLSPVKYLRVCVFKVKYTIAWNMRKITTANGGKEDNVLWCENLSGKEYLWEKNWHEHILKLSLANSQSAHIHTHATWVRGRADNFLQQYVFYMQKKWFTYL